MHGNGHCSHKKVDNGQVYYKVCRTLAQVTISCENENGKTVYDRYNSQFNDKDCEPIAPEQLVRRTGSCFIWHSRVSRCLSDGSSCLSYHKSKKKKRSLNFSVNSLS